MHSGPQENNEQNGPLGGNPSGNAANGLSVAVLDGRPKATVTGEYAAFDHTLLRTEAPDSGPCIESGFFRTAGRSLVNVSGEADLLALDEARVYGSGHARIDATDNATVVATDQVKVTVSGAATVLATGYAKVYASDSATVAAMDGSEIYASGRVKIKAFCCATVYASGDSEVEVASDNQCVVYLYGNARMLTV